MIGLVGVCHLDDTVLNHGLQILFANVRGVSAEHRTQFVYLPGSESQQFLDHCLDLLRAGSFTEAADQSGHISRHRGEKRTSPLFVSQFLQIRSFISLPRLPR